MIPEGDVRKNRVMVMPWGMFYSGAESGPLPVAFGSTLAEWFMRGVARLGLCDYVSLLSVLAHGLRRQARQSAGADAIMGMPFGPGSGYREGMRHQPTRLVAPGPAFAVQPE
jgi:hypothetical protein